MLPGLGQLSRLDRHQSTRLAWGLWFLLIVIYALAFLMAFAARDVVTSESIRQAIQAALVGGIPYPTVGALLIARQPGNAVGWVLWAVGIILAQNAITEYLADVVRLSHPGLSAGLKGANEATWSAAVVLVVTLVPLLFPTGRVLSARWRWVGWMTAAGLALFYIPLTIGGWRQGDRIVRGDDFAHSVPIAVVLIAGLALLVISAIASIASVFVRMQRAEGVERDQMRWVAFGMLLLFLVIVIVQLIPLDSTAFSIGSLVLPISMGVAIVRHRLFNLDLVISRTLLWLSLSAAVFGLYIAIVALLNLFLHDVGQVVPSLVASGLVVVGFQPIRARAQQLVNRFVFGDRDDPYAVVARLGRRLEASVSPGAILPLIVETVAQALKLPYAALAIRAGDGFALAAVHGAPIAPGTTVTLPLTYNAEEVGQLILAPRTPGEPFSAADRRLLSDLARQIGVAAYAVQLTSDLQRSREQIVTAREEERRRVRNDLHDGLGPVLSGLKLRAETARNLVHDSPEVDSLLADIANSTETAVADVRRLVHALRPPTLDDLGLVPALGELATQSRLAVELEVPPTLPPLPAAVEVAVFRIAQEALANVARHARAQRCWIRLRTDGNDFVVEIVDDGIGVPDHPVAGVGLRSMRERAAELGGTTSVRSPHGGGTCVGARIPYVRSDDADIAKD